MWVRQDETRLHLAAYRMAIDALVESHPDRKALATSFRILAAREADGLLKESCPDQYIDLARAIFASTAARLEGTKGP